MVAPTKIIAGDDVIVWLRAVRWWYFLLLNGKLSTAGILQNVVVELCSKNSNLVRDDCGM